MAAEDPEAEEELVTIVPVRPDPPEPPNRPWLGPLLIIGVPVLLAVVVFVQFFLR